MRTYETIFIVHPDVVGDQYAGVIEKFKGVLTDQGAEILKVDEWGTRKLAYQVKKQGRGTYVLVAYQAGSDVVAEFERRMRIDEKVIKFQTVIMEGGYQAPPVVEAAPQETSAEAAEATDDTAETEADAETTEEA